jgi:hypothetical protein
VGTVGAMRYCPAILVRSIAPSPSTNSRSNAVTKPSEKIRPATHSSLQPSDPRLRAEAEGDLGELVRAPDPNRNANVEGAIDVTADPSMLAAYVGGVPPGLLPPIPPGARNFTPDETVELRRQMNDPNRSYGVPYRPNEAEKLLARYSNALAEYKADYCRTRSEAKRIPYLEAKQAMIDAGLMKGDV